MYKSTLLLESGGASGMSCAKLIKKNFPEINLVGVDMDPYSAARPLVDKFIVVPNSCSLEFPLIIKEIIEENQIDLVIPCFENAFDTLSKIEGPFVNDFKSAILCKDKYKFCLKCKKIGLKTPNTKILTRNLTSLKYPQYIKPRFGVGSRDNFVVNNKEELVALYDFLKTPESFISQNFVNGEHWNVDVFADKENGFISSIERKDLRQKEGNCITVEVCSYEPLANFAKQVQEKLEIKSPFNLEVFELPDGNFIINEINVRFGGGIIFGALAGRDFVSFLLTNNKKYLGTIEKGIYSRYYNEIKVD